MGVEKILLYSPLLKWYPSHALKVTAIHKYLKCKPGKPFEWFCEEDSQAKWNGDSDQALSDTHKLKESLFYRKMIEDLMKHLKLTITTNEELVDEVFRSPFIEDLEEINSTFEIRERK